MTPRITLLWIQSIMIDMCKYTGLLRIEIYVNLEEFPEKAIMWQLYIQFKKESQNLRVIVFESNGGNFNVISKCLS